MALLIIHENSRFEKWNSCLIQDESERVEGTGCWGLVISMDDTDATSLEQIRELVTELVTSW